MAQGAFEVTADVWIDAITRKPIKEEDAVNGAFRINAGEHISTEEAEEYGLLKKVEAKAVEPVEDKAVHLAENKATKPAAKK